MLGLPGTRKTILGHTATIGVYTLLATTLILLLTTITLTPPPTTTTPLHHPIQFTTHTIILTSALLLFITIRKPKERPADTHPMGIHAQNLNTPPYLALTILSITIIPFATIAHLLITHTIGIAHTAHDPRITTVLLMTLTTLTIGSRAYYATKYKLQARPNTNQTRTHH